MLLGNTCLTVTILRLKMAFHSNSSLHYLLSWLGSSWLVGFMVLNATFNNISVISWRSVLLVEEIFFLFFLENIKWNHFLQFNIPVTIYRKWTKVFRHLQFSIYISYKIISRAPDNFQVQRVITPYFWKWCVFAYFLCTVVLYFRKDCVHVHF